MQFGTLNCFGAVSSYTVALTEIVVNSGIIKALSKERYINKSSTLDVFHMKFEDFEAPIMRKYRRQAKH